jgi:AcrR family transcriptional regulator
MSERREALIEKSLEYFLEHGVAGLSLRPLAESADTSARLLIYHFGSKDGLITAVMEEVRARIQGSFAGVLSGSSRRSGKGIMRAFWAWTIHPANLKLLRLLFEVQILAIQDPAKYRRYLQAGSSSWLELIEASLPPSKDSRATATLCAAVIDGLLLEYLSTGDKVRTTEALRAFDRVLASRIRPGGGPDRAK